MDRLQFFRPVRIVSEPGHLVTEIGSVEAALAFLHKWPVGRKGPVYQTALKCCSGAMSGQVSTDHARKALISFARITNVLAKDETTAVIPTSEGDFRPNPK